MADNSGGHDYSDLGTVDLSGTATLDLYDRVDELLDDAVAYEADGNEQAAAEVRALARVFHTCAQQWGGSEFEVRRNLAYHEVQAAVDDINTMTVNSGQSQRAAAAKSGAYKLKMLEFLIEEHPPDAPGPTDDDFPWQVGEWLYTEADRINSGMEGASVGNSSSASSEETTTPGGNTSR